MRRVFVLARAIATILLIGVVGALMIVGLAWLTGAVAHTIVNLVLDGWNNS